MMSLTFFVLACAAAASSGIFFRPDAWYRNLNKPPWQPPDWLFGPVWLVLYISIAVSGWLVWRSGGDVALPIAIYGLHLVFNALWSAVFFGMRRPGWALVEIGGLWLSLVAVIVLFHPHNAVAAYMLLPYLAWASFAAVLNLSIVRRNPA